MKSLYIFSGLGADERAFQKIDFSGYSTTFIKWIGPKENETIENYARRLLDQITTEKPTLVGLSFGGIMAIEVAKQIDTEKVIIIASVKSKNEIPYFFRLSGKLKIHKLIPPSLFKKVNPFTNWLFGATTNFDKQLLKKILKDSDPIFLKWAIDKIIQWNNTSIIKNLTHIHGTDDKILPYRFVSPDLTIKNGGHLMTLNKSYEITELLSQLIQKD